MLYILKFISFFYLRGHVPIETTGWASAPIEAARPRAISAACARASECAKPIRGLDVRARTSTCSAHTGFAGQLALRVLLWCCRVSFALQIRPPCARRWNLMN